MIELTIVVMVILILAGAGSMAYSTLAFESKQAVHENDVQNVGKAVEIIYAKTGVLPDFGAADDDFSSLVSYVKLTYFDGTIGTLVSPYGDNYTCTITLPDPMNNMFYHIVNLVSSIGGARSYRF